MASATKSDLWLLPAARGSPVAFLRTPFNELDGRISPDGKWLAYISDETGRFEIHVTSFPAAGERTQVSLNGGTEPEWGRNGKELFYRAAAKK